MNASLQRRLSRALIASIAGVALVAGVFSFAAAYDEARELQDDVLRQVGQLAARQPLPTEPSQPDPHFRDHDDNARVIVQRLGQPNPDGRPIDQGGALPVPVTLPDGLHTLDLKGESFRVLIVTATSGERVVVAQETDLRNTMALDSALRTLLPFLVLVPVLLLLVARLVRALLRPIDTLAQEVDGRAEQDLQPMATDGLPTEVRPFVAAINRLLARVAQAMAAQQRFVADAAHELRSPLAALSLQAERLAQVELPEEARARLATLRGGIERSRQQISQLLLLARAQLASPPAAAPVSARRVFRQVLEELMPLAEARHIDIGVEGSRDAPLPFAESDVHTLVRNLVDNAIRYTPEGGRVDLGVEVVPGTVRLSVCDSGPGIAPQERARVFDAFYRVPGHDAPGSGLGLAIVKTIADRLGAAVQLDYTDRTAQTGLSVTVSLPVAAAEHAG